LSGLALAWAVLACGCARREAATEVWSLANSRGAWIFSAASADLNGDAYGDLLVGVQGGAEAYFGSAQGLAKKPGWVWRSGESGNAGYCVGSAGHLDGDPYPEIYVSAPRARGRGVVYLFKTGPQGPQSRPWKVLVSPAMGDGFGERVVRAGGLYGDGYDDLAVADFSYDGQRGKVYVYRGGPRGPGLTAAWAAEGEHPGDWFGYSLCAPGDLDGDGVADLVIGSKNCNGSCLNWLKDNPDLDLHQNYVQSPAWAAAALQPMAGRLSVFYGSKTGLSARPGLVMEGKSPHELFAYELAPAGDVEGHGRAALLVGSIGWDGRRGLVEVLAGEAKGQPLRRLWRESGTYADQGLGYTLALPTGPPAEGGRDLLVGGLGPDEAWLYRGFDADFQVRKTRLLEGAPTGAQIGAFMGWAGDLYGDGRDEVFLKFPGVQGRLTVLRFGP
jgi:hypothetical protein